MFWRRRLLHTVNKHFNNNLLQLPKPLLQTTQPHLEFNQGMYQMYNSLDSLVSHLISDKILKSSRIEKVMRQIDRAHYCKKGNPYEDSPQQIGHGVTISAPHMHAMCLELLDNQTKEGMRVLDVGSGSGYLTACFGLLVGEKGKVIGIEAVEQLVEWGRENILKEQPQLLEKGIVDIKLKDGWKGDADFAPYDAIHVGAAASTVPQALVDQLKVGGRMIIPVGVYEQYLMQYDKLPDGTLKSKIITGVRYVPLIPQSP